MRQIQAVLMFLGGMAVASQAVAEVPSPKPATFAVVEGVTITVAEYQAALQQTFRARYYHFKPPEAELEKVRREVGQSLIDQILLSKDVERRGVQPDTEAVKKELDKYEARYSKSPNWAATREQALPGLTAYLGRKSRLERLEAGVKSLPQPEDAILKTYYEANPQMFTEPEQVRVSVILLKIDPSSPPDTWKMAQTKARELIGQIRAGGDFAALARSISDDPSAEKGGDMGYLHRGMLPAAVQTEVDKLAPGQLGAESVNVLEGVMIFRLEDRLQPKQRSFEEVKKRAAELWMREAAQKAWADYLAKLRAEASVTVNESVYTEAK